MLRDAFVIMPFSTTASCSESQWSENYEEIFKPAFEECQYSCQRVQPTVGRLSESIIERLHRSRVVLADITDRNANVFYELGIRHSLKRGTIIVCQEGQTVPSDLTGMWFIKYGSRPKEIKRFKEEICRLLAFLEESPDRSDSPVSDYLEKEDIAISSFVQRANVKKLAALCTELSGNLIVLGDVSRRAESSRFLSYGCLQLLCQTRYVDPGPKLLASAYELQNKLHRIELGDHDHGLLCEAATAAQNFGQQIDELRLRISRGNFSDQGTVSNMVWTAPANLSDQSSKESRDETIGNSSISGSVFLDDSVKRPATTPDESSVPNSGQGGKERPHVLLLSCFGRDSSSKLADGEVTDAEYVDVDDKKK